ncbi:MAG: hypothetical protein Q9218_007077, partial [Villophora microphyllina]
YQVYRVFSYNIRIVKPSFSPAASQLRLPYHKHEAHDSSAGSWFKKHIMHKKEDDEPKERPVSPCHHYLPGKHKADEEAAEAARLRKPGMPDRFTHYDVCDAFDRERWWIMNDYKTRREIFALKIEERDIARAKREKQKQKLDHEEMVRRENERYAQQKETSERAGMEREAENKERKRGLMAKGLSEGEIEKVMRDEDREEVRRENPEYTRRRDAMEDCGLCQGYEAESGTKGTSDKRFMGTEDHSKSDGQATTSQSASDRLRASGAPEWVVQRKAADDDERQRQRQETAAEEDRLARDAEDKKKIEERETPKISRR